MSEIKSTADKPGSVEVSLADKVAFLRQPDAYPEPTTIVETRETHMSWVFLTDRHAYKLKKPVRYAFLDYSTRDLRRAMCAEEVRLNRRLAPHVYLDAAPLVRAQTGELSIGGAGSPVDWLVKMIRLPEGSMLDQAIEAGAVDTNSVERAARHLAEFYRGAPAVRFDSADYIGRFAARIDEDAGEIAAADVPERRFADALRALRTFLDQRAGLLAARAGAGRIVEGHGDLRPEHVYLGAPPAIIDCIEFSRAFRTLDPLEELAFLRMECTRLGAPRWGDLFLDIYLDTTGDEAPEELMGFYTGARALLRAKLALAHLHDGEIREPEKWSDRADHYFDLADRAAAKL